MSDKLPPLHERIFAALCDWIAYALPRRIVTNVMYRVMADNHSKGVEFAGEMAMIDAINVWNDPAPPQEHTS